jgi:hypothetical protein
MSVSSYFTCFKSLCDEFSNYKSFSPCSCVLACSCGSLKSVQTFFDHQYVFQFLMGLNKSFAHIRGQILLMDPLPPINKVFSPVVQEESQRQIFIGTMNPNPVALITKSIPTQQNRFPRQFPWKEKPICTHCGITSHTADKCYKLHGFPLDSSSQRGIFLLQVLTMLLIIMERVFLKIHKSPSCQSLQSSVKSFWSFCRLTFIKLPPIK